MVAPESVYYSSHSHSFSEHLLQTLFSIENVGFDFQVVAGSCGDNADKFGMAKHPEVILFRCDQAEPFRFRFLANGLQLFNTVGCVVTEKTVCCDVDSLLLEAFQKAFR